jgi:delta-aminolevulinic acid dehydratase/porphobilinogen synthase
VDDPQDRQEIDSMPGVFRMGVDVMMEELESLVPKGLKSVLLFAVTSMTKVCTFLEIPIFY